MHKRTKIRLIVSGLLLTIVGSAIWFRYVFADAVYDKCIGSSDAPNMVSAYICAPCSSQRGKYASWSFAWIGPTDTVDSNVVVASADATTVTAMQRSRMYTCDHPLYWSGPTSTLHFTWFGPSGERYNPSNQISWVSFASAADANSQYVGEPYIVDGWGSGANSPVIIDVPGFKAYVEAGNPGTSIEDLGEGKKRYGAAISINQCNDNYGLSMYVYGEHSRSTGGIYWCNGADSYLYLEIGGSIDDDDDTGQAEFYTLSTIDVGDAVPSGGKQTTVKDGPTITIYFSTDKDQVDVTFSHTIYYDHGTFSLGSGNYFKDSSGNHISGDKVLETAWIVGGDKGEGADEAFSTSETKWSSVGASANDNTSPATASKTMAISTPVGQTVRKCSTITHNNKYVTFTGTSHTPTGSTTSHMDYTHSEKDNGKSQVCVVIDHPKDPEGDPKNPSVSGKPIANVMFAGEDTTLKWDITATGIASRRLVERSVIGYLVKPTLAQSYITGNTRSWTTSPLSHYNTGTTYEFNNKTWSDESVTDTEYHPKTAIVKVPDTVGAKYCNSAGYRFESYYAIDTDGTGPSGKWQHDERTDHNYWFIFKGSCRVIAKKPTTAIWNGSVFTNSGIVTAIANRHNNITFGDLASADRTVFGSWNEFLTVPSQGVGSINAPFASGSVFYKGTQKSYNESDSLGYFPLTISNTNLDDPGYSEIYDNVVLKTRLEAYFRNNPKVTVTQLTDTFAGGNYTSATSNKAIVFERKSGSLTIEGNITVSGSYDSIFSLPQVILFVDGDVNIKSDVTRIDAWIIATGKVNTCIDFKTGETASNYSGDASDGTCTKQLIFNGPVMANKLVLNRSFGSDPDGNTGKAATAPSGEHSTKSAPAEIFNLRADTYLWAYAQSTRYDSSYTESYSRELAPRY